jgi:hypothetical protein
MIGCIAEELAQVRAQPADLRVQGGIAALERGFLRFCPEGLAVVGDDRDGRPRRIRGRCRRAANDCTSCTAEATPLRSFVIEPHTFCM